MTELDNVPWPVGLHYQFLTIVFIVAAAIFFAEGSQYTTPGQTPHYVACAASLICAMLCRVIIAIKRIAKK